MKRHASMNRIYRLVWSHVHKVWVPVAEIARGRSKGSSRKLFAAVGTSAAKFTGTFDGLGHTISNLTINRAATNYVGLFGAVSGTVRNIGLLGGSVSCNNHVGGLVGSNYGTINNSFWNSTTSGRGTSSGGLGLTTAQMQ